MGDKPVPSFRLWVCVVSMLALCSMAAVSGAATTPAPIPAKKHHRRPYVRPGERSPAVPNRAGANGVEVINGSDVRTEYFPADSKGESDQTRVEVINGSVRRTQVFEEEQAKTHAESRGGHTRKNART